MESQELYCECVKESGVQQHYEDLFLSFYKSFTKLNEGEIREKVSTIIPSIDDGRKQTYEQKFAQAFLEHSTN